MTHRHRQLSSQSINKGEIEPLFADACGNTFLIYDCLTASHQWEEVKREIKEILLKANVDDALVLRFIESEGKKNKIKMHVLEVDGTEADFCGNGARAVGIYLHQNYEGDFYLVSRCGEHQLVYDEGECYVDMGIPKMENEVTQIDFDSKTYTFQFVDCIEPHLVSTDFFDAQLLKILGDEINQKYRDRFPHGVNVNCFQTMDKHTLKVLTYERGVYRLTGACGTGSCACTQVAIEQNRIDASGKVLIHVLGGKLNVQQVNQSLLLGGKISFNLNP